MRSCDFGGKLGAYPEVGVTSEATYYHIGITVESCRFAAEQIFAEVRSDNLRFIENSCANGREPFVKLSACESFEADCKKVR